MGRKTRQSQVSYCRRIEKVMYECILVRVWKIEMKKSVKFMKK